LADVSVFSGDGTAWKKTSTFTTGTDLIFRTISISGRLATIKECRSERSASKSSGTEDTEVAAYPFSMSFETMVLAALAGRNTSIDFWSLG
jgi:hypothetical protein